MGEAVVGVIVLNYLILPVAFQKFEAADMRQAFAEAHSALGPAISGLGVSPEGRFSFHCGDMRRSHWQVEAFCSSAQGYKYTNEPLGAEARTAYQAKAKRLDDLLVANGWVSDRPHDKFVTAADIDPYSPKNNGQGGEMVFHKNIGSISCNLHIMYDGADKELSVSPYALNVNGFSCQKTIRYPKFSLFNYKFEGA